MHPDFRCTWWNSSAHTRSNKVPVASLEARTGLSHQWQSQLTSTIQIYKCSMECLVKMSPSLCSIAMPTGVDLKSVTFLTQQVKFVFRCKVIPKTLEQHCPMHVSWVFCISGCQDFRILGSKSALHHLWPIWGTTRHHAHGKEHTPSTCPHSVSQLVSPHTRINFVTYNDSFSQCDWLLCGSTETSVSMNDHNSTRQTPCLHHFQLWSNADILQHRRVCSGMSLTH